MSPKKPREGPYAPNTCPACQEPTLTLFDFVFCLGRPTHGYCRRCGRLLLKTSTDYICFDCPGRLITKPYVAAAVFAARHQKTTDPNPESQS